MKIKTSELLGRPLDWAVAKALGLNAQYSNNVGGLSIAEPYSPEDREEWCPSTDWSQCGPLIDRYLVTVTGSSAESDEGQDWRWQSAIDDHPNSPANNWEQGPTALIAACRAIVAERLGHEVDVPEELL